jgi:6-phosphogluconolactonase
MSSREKPEVRVAANRPALYHEAAGELADIAAKAVAERGAFSVTLAGGSTPRGLYELLAGDPALSRAVPWERTHVFFGDERHVPPDHPDSNFRMAQVSLLSKVPVPPGHVHRIAGELPDTSRAAAEYEEMLTAHFRLSSGKFPRFDLALLGLGAEGHTASLFPGTPALEETSRLAVSTWVDKLHTHRVTLTAPVFNAAANVAFLVAGKDKAPALKAVLEGPALIRLLPAQLIRPASGRLIFFADAEAAGRLDAASRKEV